MKIPSYLAAVFGLLLFMAPAAQADITWDVDPTIEAGFTPIKADHINELRAEIEALDDQVSGAGQWTDGSGGDIHYSGGDVGIGVSNPDVDLDVLGHIKSGSGSGGVALTINDGYGNAQVTWNHVAGVPEQNGNAARITVNTDATTNSEMTFQLGENVTGGVGTALTNIMTLEASGEVGIGTTNPTDKLHVSGGQIIIDNTSYPRLIHNVSGTSYWSTGPRASDDYHIYREAGVGDVIINAGNVGIGTTSPSQKLSVAGNIDMNDGEVYMRDTAGSTYGIGYATEGGGQLTLFSDDQISFTESDGDVVRVHMSMNSGNVGIGTINPAHQLHLTGNLRTDGRQIFFGGGNQRLFGDASSALYNDSGHSTITQMYFRDNEDTVYGRVYGDGNGTGFGLLDGDSQWAVRSIKDSHISLHDNNEQTFAAGQGGVSGNYGTVQTYGGGKGGWEGYSINGRYNFMSQNNETAGIYNDVDNRWIMLHDRNDYLRFYEPDSGNVAMQIQPNGNVGIDTISPSSKLEVNGTVTATAFVGDGSGLTGLSGDNLGNHTGTQDLTFNNYGIGVVGTYSSTRYQNLFSMGAAYTPADNGTTLNNMYGIAWTHDNVGGESIPGLGHQALFVGAGDTRSAVGYGIWTKYDITGNRFMDQNHSGYYLDPGSVSYLNDIRPNIIYDRNNTGYYLNPDGTSNTLRMYAQADMRAPIFYDINNTAYYANPASESRFLQLRLNGNLRRAAHNVGHLEGSYNNVGGNGAQSNPIYSIGSSYNPGTTTLSNFYGVGYADGGSASFLQGNASGWGFYVAADGDARTFLSGAAGGNSHINANGGNVGIGTASPAHKLHLAGGNALFGGNVYFNGTNAGDELNFESQNGFHRMAFNQLRFYDWGGGGDNMTINNGRVGIGTASPSQTLDVAGNIELADQLYLGVGSSGWDWLNFDGDGKNLRMHYGSTNNELRFGRYTGAWAHEANPVRFDMDAPADSLLVDGNGHVHFTGGTYMYGSGKEMIRHNDSYLRLNQAGHFSSGVHTPGRLWANSGLYVGDDESIVQYGEDIIGTSDTFRLTGGSNTLQFNDSNNDNILLHHNSDRLYFMLDSNNNLSWDEASGTHRITMSGSSGEFRLGIGSDNPGYKLDVNGTARATAFIYSSDERLKTGIRTVEGGLDLVNQLRGVRFDWKKDGKAGLGFIAQEVEAVLPELVETDSEGMKSVQYGNITAVLVEAVKEQQSQIEALQAEVEALKGDQ